MRNSNLLIAGAIGSGKSTLARALKTYSARVITLDSMDEYEGDFVALDYDEAARYFVEHRHGPFDLVCRMGQEEQYALLDLAFYAQRTEPHGPLVCIMEEATEHSTTWTIEGVVQKYYVKGRHARISTITVVQQDTDINRITKHGAACVVGFWQNYLSSSWERYFKWDQIQSLIRLEDDTEYGGYLPEPIQGRHFITSPDLPDLYSWWWERHGYIAKLS